MLVEVQETSLYPGAFSQNNEYHCAQPNTRINLTHLAGVIHFFARYAR